MVHIKFGDNSPSPDVEGAASTSGHHSAGTDQHALRCLNSVRTDFNTKEECYVFDIAANSNKDAIAVSLSNSKIKLYSVDRGPSLSFLGELTGKDSIGQTVSICI